ncbi:MAG: hypothetical protein JXR53_01645, partial [Bacteroidales bacterium]|nr:hypothetical protein [Bacteroidales bacterium]
YLLIEKWKAVSPGLSPSNPNAPRLTSMLAKQIVKSLGSNVLKMNVNVVGAEINYIYIKFKTTIRRGVMI